MTGVQTGKIGIRTGWRSVRFGDVVVNINDYFDRDRDGVHTYVAGPNIDEQRLHIAHPSSARVEDIPPTFKRLFKSGDVLFHSRNVAKLAVPDFAGITGEKLFVLRPKDERIVSQAFLPFLMSTAHFKDYVTRNLAGSVNKFLNWKALADYEFPLPPIEEQKRIAEILWATDEVVKEQRQVQAHEDTLKTIVSLQLIQRGVSGRSLKKSEAGPIPENWETTTLKRLVTSDPHSLLAGPFGTIFKAKDFRDEGIPIIQLRHVTDHGFDWGDGNTYMDVNVYQNLHQSYTVQSGDLLITKLGDPPGIACLYPQSMSFGMVTPDVVRAVLDKTKVLPEFALLIFNNPLTKKRILRLTKGGTRPRVSLDELFNLALPLPPLQEQRRIIDTLSRFGRNTTLRRASIQALKGFQDNFLESEMQKNRQIEVRV